MRCRLCDYRLWNIAARRCPECGEPFQPSDFEFARNSVRYLCPHCSQDYYGDGPGGHLQPAEFDCVQCHHHIHMDQMILLPTQDVSEEQTAAEVNPWLDRKRIGFFKAWFSTIGRGMTAPQRLIRVTPVDSSTSQAIGYAITCSILFGLVGIAPLLLFMLIGPMMAVGAGGVIGVFGASLTIAVVSVVIMLVSLLLWVLTAHVVLVMSGKVEGGFSRTCHAICYGAGANVFSAVPCLSAYVSWIGWIWWLVAAVIMLHVGHRVSPLRATIAGLVMPLLVIVLTVGGVVFAFYSAMTAFNMATAAAGTPGITLTQGVDLGSSARVYVDQPDAPPLQHGAQLLDNYAITAADLILDVSNTSESTIRVGDVTLQRFILLDPDEQQEMIQTAIDSLPAGAVAHRMGDIVFTWHGIDWTQPTSGLWIAIQSPDPDVNISGPSPLVYVYLADGSSQPLAGSRMASHLARQNRLRATFNLPPLPDPSTVTQRKPAVKSPDESP